MEHRLRLYQVNPIIDLAERTARELGAHDGDADSVLIALGRWRHGSELSPRERAAIVARFCPGPAGPPGSEPSRAHAARAFPSVATIDALEDCAAVTAEPDAPPFDHSPGPGR
jgi:hypothetical protein